MESIGSSNENQPRPKRPARSPAAHRPGFVALIIEVAFRLHVARLNEHDGRLGEFLLPLALGGDFRGPLLPLGIGKQVPVAAIDVALLTIERQEVDVVLAPYAGRAEFRFVGTGYRFKPLVDRLVVDDKDGDFRRLATTAAAAPFAAHAPAPGRRPAPAGPTG